MSKKSISERARAAELNAGWKKKLTSSELMENISKAIKQSGETCRDVAWSLGTDPSLLSRALKGNPYPAVAAAFGYTKTTIYVRNEDV